MIISLWRKGLKVWLNKVFKIASFDLRQPIEYGEWVCFLPPLANLSIRDGDSPNAVAIQDIHLSVRYRADTRYIDLPLEDIEGVVVSFQLRLLNEYQSIAPLSSLIVLQIADTIKVSEYGDGMADWLVSMVFAVELTWVPELEPVLAPPPAQPITSIVNGLFVTHLTPLAPLLTPPESFTDIRNRDKFGEIITKVDSN